MFTDNKNKPVFGCAGTTSSFGFGTYAQTNQPTFSQSSCFGSSPGFGTSPALLQAAVPKPKGLFSNTTTAPQQVGIGTGNVFDLQQNNNPFGGSEYGQQNKGFGYDFGTPQIPSLGQKGSLTKFTPVKGFDTISQKGVPRNINTKLNSIVCMKEYESKSQEELRWEDYESNRKGVQQASQTFGGYLGQAGNTSTFRKFESKPIFGEAKNKALFGQTNLANQQFSSFGVTYPATKPFDAMACAPLGVTASQTPFNFTAPTPAFSGKTFNSVSLPGQFQFSMTTPVTGTSQPTEFGSSYNQTNAQQKSFNTPSLVGQTGPQTNFFQTPKTFPSFGATNTSPSMIPFGKTTSLGSFQSVAKLGQGYNFEQASNVQPAKSPFDVMPNSMTSQKPISYNVEQNHVSMMPNHGFPLSQDQQQPALGGSDNLHDFYSIVDKVYETFPYRSIFEGVSVKLYMDKDTTNPRKLDKIINQEPLPLTSLNEKPKLKMLSGPIPTTNFNLKYKWLEDSEGVQRNVNNFTFGGKKSSKSLKLSKKQLLNDKLPTKMFEDATDHIEPAEQLHIDKEPAATIIFEDTPLKTSSPIEVLENRINTDTEDPEDPEFLAKEKELISLFREHFVKDVKNSQNPLGDVKNSKTWVLARQTEATSIIETPHQQENGTAISSQEQKLASPPSVKSSLKDLIGDKNYKSNFTPNLLLSRLGSNLKELKVSKESTKKSIEVGDNPNSNTSGIKLSREGYYTIPALEEIHKHRNEQGECIVEGFIVGRQGFGKIYFPDKVNLTNIDLDEIVYFNFHEAIIYPDDTIKPQLGEGLNRPAEVTLERVWPRHRKTRKLMTDPKEILEDNFVERLTALSRKQDAVFVDYVPETGSWVFRVEHFSKFSYPGNDDKKLTVENLTNELKVKNEIEKKMNGFPRLDLRGAHPQAEFPSFCKERQRSIMMMIFSFSNGMPSNDSEIGAIELHRTSPACSPAYVALSNQAVPMNNSSVASTISYMDAATFRGTSFKLAWGPTFLFIKSAGFKSNPVNEKRLTNCSECFNVENRVNDQDKVGRHT